MHEMSLAEGILQRIEEIARRENASQIKTVVLEIGRLSPVEPEALRFCFDAVTHGGIAQSAKLEIIHLPGEGWCMACAAKVPLDELWSACPRCGGYQVQATSGTEMRIKEIEIV